MFLESLAFLLTNLIFFLKIKRIKHKTLQGHFG